MKVSVQHASTLINQVRLRYDLDYYLGQWGVWFSEADLVSTICMVCEHVHMCVHMCAYIYMNACVYTVLHS